MSRSFKVRRNDIHEHNTRKSNYLKIEKVKLKCSKPVFYYKGAKIFNDFMKS